MKLHRDSSLLHYRISAWQANQITLQPPQQPRCHEQPELIVQRQSFIISSNSLEPWPYRKLDELTPEVLEDLCQRFSFEIFLLGSGAQHRYPETALFTPLISRQCGFEVMSTAAACRTFNVLVDEARPLLAAMLLET
ncbi:MAG: hypothetical protein HQL49_01570 [Gammaproteobacteria bacterium]|nr:hypothetical protein [Gammaproteobacteria bacterium]